MYQIVQYVHGWNFDFCLTQNKPTAVLNFTLSHIIQYYMYSKYWEKEVPQEKTNWIYNFTSKVNLLTKF